METTEPVDAPAPAWGWEDVTLPERYPAGRINWPVEREGLWVIRRHGWPDTWYIAILDAPRAGLVQ